jgi:hypothetical protein
MNDFTKALAVCLPLLAGGIAWGVTNFVPLSQWEQHLKGEESRYVLELKKSIRDIRQRLRQRPDDAYLLQDLQETIDTLCELRPDDKLCK